MVNPIPYHDFEQLGEDTFQVLAAHYGFDLDAHRNDPDSKLTCTRSQVRQIQSLQRRIEQVSGQTRWLRGRRLDDQLETLYNTTPESWMGAWFALDACSKAFAAFAIPTMREWIKDQRRLKTTK